MSYTLAQYLQIGDPIELERRFDNLRLLATVYKTGYDELRDILANPTSAQHKIDWYESQLGELKQGMQTIIDAIDILKSPENQEEEYDDEDDD